MSSQSHKTSWAAVALTLATATPVASAQDTAPGAPGVSALEEVVVTSRRREESLADVPVAVTAIGASQINALQIYSVKDVAAYTPGLNINSDSVGRAFVSIRGVGTTLIDTVQPGVGIFIDGIYQPNTSYLNSPLLDVERIEVLRGPQGTLFGNNTLGGAINVITQQPDNEFRGRVNAVYAGPDDFQSAAVSVSGALVPDLLQVRAGVAHHSHDGFMKNELAGGEGNPLDQRSANTTVILRPLEGAKFTLNARYDEVEGGSTPYRWVDGPTDYQYSSLSNLNSIASYEYKSVDLTGEFDIAALNTTMTATGAFYRRDQEGDSDGDYGPVDFVRRANESRLDTTTAEVRFDTTFNDQLSTLFGVFLNESETDAALLTTVVPLGVTVPSESSVESESLGIFANVFYRLSDTLELAFGLRYDEQELEGSAASTAERYEAEEWQPRVSLTRFWSDDVMTYASIARGFRAGGQNGPGAPNLIYKGDSVWTYEVGSKTSLLDGQLNLNMAAFYNDYQDFIGQNAIAPNQDIPESFITVDLNTGDVESYGIELEAHYTPAERWIFDGSLTLLHARITDDAAFRETTGFGLPTDRILFTPDWNFHVSGNYVHPLGENSLTFNLGLTGKGEREGSSLSETFSPTLDAYYLVDGFVAYQRGALEVALFAKNLLNEEYFESYIDQSLLQRAGLPPALISSLGIPGAERRIGVRVSMEF